MKISVYRDYCQRREHHDDVYFEYLEFEVKHGYYQCYLTIDDGVFNYIIYIGRSRFSDKKGEFLL